MMFTPTRIKVAIVLLLIAATATWSKLRLLEPEDQEPQRWRVDEYPGFQKTDPGIDSNRLSLEKIAHNRHAPEVHLETYQVSQRFIDRGVNAVFFAKPDHGSIDEIDFGRFPVSNILQHG